MKIIHKFSLMVAVIIIMIVTIGASTLISAKKIMRNTAKEEIAEFVANQIKSFDWNFNDTISLVEVFVRQTDVLDWVQRSNLAYEAMPDTQSYIDHMDQDWISKRTPATDLFKELAANPLSREISKMATLHNRGTSPGPFGEIFITNRWGAVVSLNNRTSDFRQDDEYWWQAAKESMKHGGVYLAPLAYDESSESWDVALAIALQLPDGTFAGVIKVSIRAQWIIARFGEQLELTHENPHEREHRHWYLLTAEGRVLYSSEPFIFLQQVSDHINFQEISRLGTGILDEDHSKYLDVFTTSKGFGKFPGLGWILLLKHNKKQSFAAIDSLLNHLATTVLIVTGIAFLFGVGIFRYLRIHIAQLTRWVCDIGQGQPNVTHGVYPNDEFGTLAGALHNMVGKLTQITVSRNQLQRETQERAKVEKILRKERDFNALLLASTVDGIYVTDLNGRCTFINHSGLTFLGFSSTEEVIGREMHALIHHTRSNGTAYPLSECLAHGPSHQDQTLAVTEDLFFRHHDIAFPVEYSTQPMYQHGIIVGSVTVFRDITERKAYETNLQYMANYDFLTGLPNRHLFLTLLEHASHQADRLETLLAIIILDIDHFKNINDAFGHLIGDKLLKVVASDCSRCLRNSDTVARFASDEFVLICENFHNIEQVETLMGNIIGKISAHSYPVDGLNLHITASIGFSIYPFTENPEKLLQQADMAMYQAKKAGRNSYQHFSWTMENDISKRVQIDLMLRVALDKDEFELVYQPKQNLSQGSLVGMEVLLRLNSSLVGQVSPAVFIPAAEETGHILKIGTWVLRTACEKFVSWPPEMTKSLVMSVNISTRQIQEANFQGIVEQILRETGMDGHHLELEITESTIMKNISRIRPVLQAMRTYGIRIAIDDFGTGYSSLGYLKNLPIDTLKIDRSFVRDLDVSESDRAIVDTIISMAHRLGLHVIAEGAEEAPHVNILRERGCDELQGYFYSKPLSEAKFLEFCHQKQSTL
ncbi:diguanylate cyclase [Gammaproteobacteria bacterium]